MSCLINNLFILLTSSRRRVSLEKQFSDAYLGNLERQDRQKENGQGVPGQVSGQVPNYVPNHGFQEGPGAGSESRVPGRFRGRFRVLGQVSAFRKKAYGL